MGRMTGGRARPSEAVTAVHEIVPDRPLDDGVPDPHSFVLSLGNEVFPLHEGENLIGRESGCDVQLGSSGVSRKHARITIAGGRAIIEDLGSKNGTFVHQNLIDAPTEISDTDAIRLGTVWLYFRAPHEREA